MKTKQGVSLIVLVLTIVIMIILGGVIILNLSNSGIIDKADNTVSETNLKEMNELASIGWALSYGKGARSTKDLYSGVLGYLLSSGIEQDTINKYSFDVTNKGVSVTVSTTPKVDGWNIENSFVVNGAQILEIGDVVNYKATGTSYTGQWKVLGADDEGNLLIMSASDVAYKTFNENNTLEGAQDAWLNGPKQLDALCEPFGDGTGALKVRSIKIEDVAKAFNSTIVNNEKEVKIFYNGTTTPSCIYGTSDIFQMDTNCSNGLYFYDSELKKFVEIKDIEDEEKGEAGELIGTITTYGGEEYGRADYTNTSKVSTMIFGEYIQHADYFTANYWLASTWVHSWYDSATVAYGIDIIDALGSTEYDEVLWEITQTYIYSTKQKGVRAVVTLDKNIEFTGSSETGWSY